MNPVWKYVLCGVGASLAILIAYRALDEISNIIAADSIGNGYDVTTIEKIGMVFNFDGKTRPISQIKKPLNYYVFTSLILLLSSHILEYNSFR